METHTATLFFAGDRVYKLKKPVVFPFLDFSTCEARKDACLREVALNARLAPDVYLGVATVLGVEGRECDHLVVMRRMPDDRRLTRMLHSVEARGCIRSIARTIAAFHAAAETSPDIARAGTREAVAQNWRDNFDQMRRFADRYLDRPALVRAQLLAERFLAGRRRLFAHRIAAGKIRDGHGDLLADDIFCLDDGPRILDCIEFRDDLRYGDVIGDVAFLAMDIERIGRPDLAAELLSSYREYSADDAPDALVDMSIAYRAQVRSKVACLRAEQAERDAVVDARALLSLAIRHLEKARVRLVLIGGLPGTGKTTLSHILADDRGWAHLHSDEMRKERAGLPPSASARAAFGEGIYTPEITRATYRAMIARARTMLGFGQSVILDASWTDQALREEAAAVAQVMHADLVAVRCIAPEDLATSRIANRNGSTASDATPEVARLMARRADNWPGASVVDTSSTPLAALRRLRWIVDRDAAPDVPDAVAR